MSKTPKAPIKPEMIRWAREKSNVSDENLDRKFPKWRNWMAGDEVPTFGDLEKFSTAIRIPIGYFFLDKAPTDDKYKPEFRTLGNRRIDEMSPELRDVLFINQSRQDWYRDFSLRMGLDKVDFVGSLSRSDLVYRTAQVITNTLNIEIGSRSGSVSDFISRLTTEIENLGILVVRVGFAGTNTNRTLDPEEFRGFALSDELAPLIFVNGADTRPAQIFSLIHELLHIGIGVSGVATTDSMLATERWANKVVGEVLAPKEYLLLEFDPTQDLSNELERLASILRCSPLVVGYALVDADVVTKEAFKEFENEYLVTVLEARLHEPKPGGGNYYLSKPYQTSRLFAEAIIRDTWTRGTTFTEALGLLQIRSAETLDRFAAKMGIA